MKTLFLFFLNVFLSVGREEIKCKRKGGAARRRRRPKRRANGSGGKRRRKWEDEKKLYWKKKSLLIWLAVWGSALSDALLFHFTGCHFLSIFFFSLFFPSPVLAAPFWTRCHRKSGVTAIFFHIRPTLWPDRLSKRRSDRAVDAIPPSPFFVSLCLAEQ